MTVNGVGAYTLGLMNGPWWYRLARGIRSLQVGALAAGGASSLCTSREGCGSRVCRICYYKDNIVEGRSKGDIT